MSCSLPCPWKRGVWSLQSLSSLPLTRTFFSASTFSIVRLASGMDSRYS